jgi:hypothetical protein
MAEDSFRFYFKRNRLLEAFRHISKCLDWSTVSSREASAKEREILLDGERITLPWYEDSENGDEETLAPLDAPFQGRFHTGMWVFAGTICDHPTKPLEGIRNGNDVELLQFDFWMTVQGEFVRLDIEIWGGQWWGAMDDDEQILNFATPLEKLSEIYMFDYDNAGIFIHKPKNLNEIYEELPWDSPIHSLEMAEYISTLYDLAEGAG